MPGNLDDSAIHHSAPDSGPVVLIVVDMFSDYESADTRRLYTPALHAARRVRALRLRTARARIPTIFVNDNYGRWRSAGWEIANRARRTERGNNIVRLLAPSSPDYFVLKPKHSVFLGTPLDVLLLYLGAKTLILAGSAGTQCVLFSAIDAYMRDYRICTPMDCIVCEDAAESRIARHIFRKTLHADTSASNRLDLRMLVRQAVKIRRQ